MSQPGDGSLVKHPLSAVALCMGWCVVIVERSTLLGAAWILGAVALLVTAPLLGCTSDLPSDLPTTAAATGEASDCAPGSLVCIDERTSAVCGADGALDAQPLTCPDGLRCEPQTGHCGLPFCEAGAYTCADSEHLRRCQDDGRAYEPALGRCLGGRTCNGGRCTVCIPGALTCTTDRELSRCRPDGSRWEQLRLCGANLLCHSPSASCISTQCDGDSLLCASPNAYRVCRGPEAGWSEALFACNLQEICTGGACVFCPDGPTRCAPNGDLEICDASAGGYRVEPCPLMSACSGSPAACGVPPPPFCLAGAYDCAHSTALSLCNATGNGWEPGLTYCAMDERCGFGACLPGPPERRVMLVVEGSVRVAPHWATLFAGIWHAVSRSPLPAYGMTIFPSHVQPTLPPSFPQLPLGHLNGASILAAVFAANPPAGSAPLIETLDRLSESHPLFLGKPGVTVVIILAGAPQCDAPEAECAAALDRATRILHQVHDASVYAIVWRDVAAAPWAQLIADAGTEMADGGAHKPPPLATDGDSLAAAIGSFIAAAPSSPELAPP